MSWLTEKEWVAVVRSDDVVAQRGLANKGPKGHYHYYRTKYEIAARYQPKVIVEIGVRWGYSAFAFLRAAPEAEYIGFDLINGEGGVPQDTFGHIRETFAKHYPLAKLSLNHENSQQRTWLPEADFYHIDGDHSTPGARHDMEMAWKAMKPGTVMLIDDYETHPPVRVAVDAFIKAHKEEIKSHQFISSRHGECVIEK